LREWQCGHLNHEVPRLLRGGEPGRGRVVIDVGLGFGAEETLGAVENGFVVFAFEPLPANVEAVEGRLTQLIPGRFLVVRLERREQQQPGAQGAGGGGWRVPELAPPAEPEKGFAFIIHAGLDDGSRTTAHMPAAGLPSHTETVGDSGASDGGATTVPVPLLKLDDALPAWAAHGGGDRQQALLLKIDTQGWELRVLRGASRLLEERAFRYVLYELSPWLMRRASSGDPLELVQLLPSKGAVCFDMMGTHNKLPRPSAPLGDYLGTLDTGRNGDGNYFVPIPPGDDFRLRAVGRRFVLVSVSVAINLSLLISHFDLPCTPAGSALLRSLTM
jgi:FkbM family methyltransferase